MNSLSKDSRKADVLPVEEPSKYLTFVLAGRHYGINILRVREILEYIEVTPMPMMPTFIAGVINLRGNAVPVIDLAVRLGIEHADISRRTCIVVVELHTELGLINIGVIVEAVSKVVDFNKADIEPVPKLGTNIRTDFIEGMGNVEGDFLVLLNIDRLLTEEDAQSLAGLTLADS